MCIYSYYSLAWNYTLLTPLTKRSYIRLRHSDTTGLSVKQQCLFDAMIYMHMYVYADAHLYVYTENQNMD